MQQRGSKLGVPSGLTSANVTTVVLVQYKGRNALLDCRAETHAEEWPASSRIRTYQGVDGAQSAFLYPENLKKLLAVLSDSIRGDVYQLLEEASMLYALLP